MLKSKQDNNFSANILNKEQIDDIIHIVFETCYLQVKGKAKKEGVDYPIPYVVKFHNEYWANPYAFSWTKSLGEGYPTIPYKLNQSQTVQWAPKSTSIKSSWLPRIPIHCVIWRWANEYQEIPKDLQISHHTDQHSLLSPEYLLLEDGVINRSRSACQKHLWYLEPKGCHNEVRCPHSPRCRLSLKSPQKSIFKLEKREAPGIPTNFVNQQPRPKRRKSL